MTSTSSTINPLQDSTNTSFVAQSNSGTNSSQQAGRGPVGNGNKRQSSVNISGHSKTDSLSNSKGAILPAVPSLAGSKVVNGNHAVNTASLEHSRKPSVTITAAGLSGQLPNAVPMATNATANVPQFGSINASSMNASIHSPNNQNASLYPNSQNPRISSPAQSPSPIPQPAASGGRPPSSLNSTASQVSFGNFGPEDPNRNQRPSISGMSSGSLTPNMASVPLRRESSQQSNSDMNGNMNMSGNRGGYSNRGRGGGYTGNHMGHQQWPNSPGPNYRQPNTPRTGGPNGSFPANNRSHSYGGQGMPGAPSPSTRYAQPVTPGPMGMVSPGMQGQPQYYQQQMVQPVNQHLSLKSSSSQHQQRTFKGRRVSEALEFVLHSIPTPVYDVPLPTNLAPESGQFEEWLTLRQQAPYYVDPTGGQYYYNQYNMPPNMQQMQPFFPASPRPVPAMTPQQGQFMPSQYGQPPQSMSRTPSSMGERSSSTAGHPPATPVTPNVNMSNPAPHQPSPAIKSSAFTIPKKTGGIKIVNPATREELKIEKAPESPAVVAPSKSPATVSTNPTPPSRTPDSHARSDSKSIKIQPQTNDLAAKFKAEVAAKAEADKHESEKLKKQPEPEVTDDAKADAGKSDLAADTDPIKPSEEAPTIVEPPKTDTADGERELTEEDDEYWEKIEEEERRKEEEREKAYKEKKQREAEEKAKQKVEQEAKANEELRRQEQEAEAAEEAREAARRKKEQEGGNDDEDKEKDAFAGLRRSENAFKATESPAVDSGVATPTSDASSSMPPPPARNAEEKGKGKVKPAALKLKTSEQVEAPTPSAALQSLRSARFLTRIDEKTYPAAIASPNPALNPADIASPNPALNSAVPMGKFRYDKNFLMQFQSVFTEKPSETWSDKIRETVGDADTPSSSKGGGRGYANTISGPRPSNTPKTSVVGMNFGTFGSFGGGASARGTTSKERYEASTRQLSNKPPYMQPNFPGVFAGSSDMRRTTSSTSVGHPQSPRNNPSRSGRGGSRAGTNPKVDAKANAAMPLTAGKDVGTLQISETGWKPRSVGQNAHAGPPPGGDSGYLAPDVVQRKVKSNLNKMTPTTFDKISGQIIDIVMQSKQETDGRTLRQVIQLTFEKATDEAHWAAMYAEFCFRMLQSMTPEIRDEGDTNKAGTVASGNTLFRRYLLNRCQQEFEAGWKSKLPEKPEGEEGEAAMMSEEYYAAAVAKRRGLGLVRFIGELYKLGMLTSKIMILCVQRLLEYEGMPDEAEIESLSNLLQTIGEPLENDQTGHMAMDAFFQRINQIEKLEGLPSRMKFMLLDLQDLRKAKWHGKGSLAKGPSTIEEIHAQAAAQEREKEAQRLLEQTRSRGGAGGGRMPMGRNDARYPGSMGPPPQNNSVALDDLRRLGRSGSRQASAVSGPQSFGPSSMFNKRGSNPGGRSLGVPGRGGDESGASSRTATPPAQKKDDKATTGSTNAFSALASLDPNEGNEGPGSPPSTAVSPALSHSQLGSSQHSKSPLRDEDESGK